MVHSPPPHRKTTLAMAFFIFFAALGIAIAFPTVTFTMAQLEIIDPDREIFVIPNVFSFTAMDLSFIMAFAAGSVAIASFVMWFIIPQTKKTRRTIKKAI